MADRYVTADEIAKAIGGVVWGNSSQKVYGIALPKDSDETMLTYFESHMSTVKSRETEFAVCVVPMKYKICDNRTYIVISSGVYEILHMLVGYLIEKGLYTNTASGIYGDKAFISQTAKIGRNCRIGNNVSIMDDVIIGDNCMIGSNVVIEHGVNLGNNVCIQSGAVIGCDSFEYAENNGYQKVHNLGTVLVGDHVVIGANTTVARGTIGNTIIGARTIVDTLVQIGHEVVIGENCKICSQCGLSGWAVLEDNVTLYGKVGVSNHVVIGKNAVVLAMSGVTKHVKENTVVSGIPAKENKDYLKEKAFINRLVKGDIK